MARDENPPFQRGETYYNGGTIDTADLGGLGIEGQEWVFDDVDPNNPTTARTNQYVRCRAVRNTSAAALLPKRLVDFENDTTEYGARVDGYSTTTAAQGYPVDEYLPVAGCPVNDICWIVIEGPAVVSTTLVSGAATVMPNGSWVVAATAATSGATTSGRVEVQVLTGATAPLANQVQNRVGRALSAATTANTASDLLVMVGKW